jgi:AcrR family transcriptional regulator
MIGAVITAKSRKDGVTELRCAEILTAARTVFATKGYHTATVDDIAELAGVAKGTIYCYFPSKSEVFEATVRQGTVELFDRTHKNMSIVTAVQDKIRAFIRTRLQHGDRNREFIRIYFTEYSNMAAQPSPIRAEIRDLHEKQAHVLEGVILAGIAAGEIRPLDALRAAYFIYEATRSAMAHRVQGWDSGSVEETESFLFDFVWRGLECK